MKRAWTDRINCVSRFYEKIKEEEEKKKGGKKEILQEYDFTFLNLHVPS